MSFRRTMRLVAALAGVILTGMPRAWPATDQDPEDELKSVIVKNFLRYSTWPAGAGSHDPITVGVLGRPSFVQALRALLDGKSVTGRAIQIVEIKSSADSRMCQLLYLATDKAGEIRQVLESVRSPHTLTMGEADHFLEYGGIVNLQVVDGHMSFEVNLDALEHSGVAIEAKLLRLGLIKRRRG